jgi:hypothetical protein
VVGDLQEVHLGEAPSDEGRVDLLLDVPREQEPVPAHLAQEDDRDVVDPGPVIRRPFGNGADVRPEDPEADVVQGEVVARGDDPALDASGRQRGVQGSVAGPGSDHPGFEDPFHGVPAEQRREPGRVVLVGVAQDHHVNPPIPGRQLLVQRHEEAAGIRAPVDEEPAAALALEEDCVALSDVEHRQARDPVRAVDDGDGERHDRRGKAAGEDTRGPDPPPPAARHRRTGGGLGGSGGPGRRSPGWLARTRVPGAAAPSQPAVGTDDDNGRGRGNGGIPRRLKRQARERDRCPGPDEPDDRGEERPGRQSAEGRDRHRCPGEGERAGDECHRRRRHGSRDQRDHSEADDGRHDRQPPELEGDDRQRRQLRCERDAEGFGKPGADAAWSRSRQARRQRAAPRDQAGRGERREAKPDVADEAGVGEEHQRDRPADRGRGVARTAELAREQDDAGHRGRPDDRRRRSDEDDVGDDGNGGQRRPAPPRNPAREGAQGRRHDRDVPAGDRDHVGGADGREVGREIAVHAVPEADHDARREPGLGLRDGAREGLVGAAPEALQRPAGTGRRGVRRRDRGRRQRDGARADGSRRADPKQVRAVLAVRPGLELTVDLDDVARHDHRPRGEGGGEPKPGRLAKLHDRRPVSLPKRTDRDDSGRPRPGPGREPDVNRRELDWRREEAQRDQARSGRGGRGGPSDRRAPEQHRGKSAGQGRASRREDDRQGDLGRRTAGRAHRRGKGRGGERTDRQPAAAGHGQRTVTRSRSPSKAFWPRSFRVRRSSTDANGVTSRAAMIFVAVTGPIPGSASSSACVAWLRSTSPSPPPDATAADPPPPGAAAGSSRDGTMTCSPSLSTAARFSALAARAASTRGP